MPMRPQMNCAYPSCKVAVDRGYCEEHKNRPLEMARERDAQRYKDKPWRNWYNLKPWKKNLQPACLARDPLCKLMIMPLCKQHGGDASEVADHIVDHHGDPKLFYDMNNLQGACVACHNAKKKNHSGLAPVGSDAPGKVFTAAMDTRAVDAALVDDEDLSDVRIP